MLSTDIKHDRCRSDENRRDIAVNKFSKIRALVFDLDGTVYEGDSLVDGVLETINRMRHQGFSIYFCTNNSTRTRQEVAN